MQGMALAVLQAAGPCTGSRRSALQAQGRADGPSPIGGLTDGRTAAEGALVDQALSSPSFSSPREFASQRRGLLLAALAAPLAGLSGCAGLGLPYSVNVDQGQIADALAHHFPATQRVAEVFDVTVSSPRVWLVPEHNHLGAAFALEAADRLFGKRLQGHMSLESGLRFDVADASLRLADVRVDEFAFDSGGASLPIQGQRLGSLLAEQLLNDVAVYRMKPEQADLLRRFGVKNADIGVSSGGVKLTLHA
jgi:hypothetical protein